MKIPSIYAKGFEKTENGGLKMAQGHPSADSLNTKKAGMKGTGKEIPMRCRESGKSLLPPLAVFASVLLAQSALAVTYKASLPIEPVHPRYAYCGGVTSATATPGANETLVVPVGHNLKSNIDGNSSLLVASASSQQWRLHNPAERSAFLNISNLFVEGIENGSETLTVDITANDGRVILSDVVNYSLIAADCYSKPTVAEKTIYTADNRFPSLRSAGCEWSISPNSATIAYNCIAWSIGVNTRKFTPADFGCPNNEVLPTEEQVDDFYSDHGYERTSIDQATVFYYSGFHASKRINCSCGNDKWIMLSSKCGSGHIVEHRKEHLTEFYGTILYGYKKTQE